MRQPPVVATEADGFFDGRREASLVGVGRRARARRLAGARLVLFLLSLVLLVGLIAQLHGAESRRLSLEHVVVVARALDAPLDDFMRGESSVYHLALRLVLQRRKNATSSA